MLWGVVGLFIMVAVFGIMRILLNTFGETKIQVNNNGDFNVKKTDQDPNLTDKNVADSTGSNQDLFGQSIDVSNSKDFGNLPIEEFITNPFPIYEAKPSVCWNNKNKPFYAKASTEFNALEAVKASARNKYLSDNNISDKDVSKQKYPMILGTIVLYDKNNKAYHAWLDARAPVGAGVVSDCSLKIVTPAREVPASIIFSQSDVSSITDSADQPADVYITSPFPTYEPKPQVCWNNNNKAFYSKASTEFNALNQVKANARLAYLTDTKSAASDPKKANYPITFASKVLYEKKTKTYYAWLDARAPVGTGKLTDCNLKVVTAAPVVPDSIVFSQVNSTNGEINLSETTIKSTITDFTKSPFVQKYIDNPLCWRKELYGSAPTEFTAGGQVKVKARLAFLDDNNLNEKDTPQTLPIAYASFTAYDKVTKNYYVWWDARGPIKGGKVTDCNLIATGPAETLSEPTGRSAKPNPLKTYASDNLYYRVVDSGADTDYVTARNIAINNALIQIAQLKGLNSVSAVTYKVILEEKYYPQDIYTLNYDYWVAIESPR